MMRVVLLLLAASVIGMAGVGASLVSIAWGQAEPGRTVTVNVATGVTGPQGPPGPAGEVVCPAGSSKGNIVFIQQGQGPTELTGVCIVD